MKHVIHVHQQRIRQGLAAIIDRTYKGSTHHRHVDIVCPNCGHTAASVVQSEQPDHCGARVVIRCVETNTD